MSAFEVSVTPTREKINRKNENREPTIVVLAPFSAKATVTFEDVPVTKCARRIICIQNPSNDDIKVMVTKCIKPEYNITLEWTSNFLKANSEIQMEIVWSPVKVVTCKETIQITDSRNFKKDISVILKSSKAIQKKLKAGFKHGITYQAKNIKFKTPSPSKTKSSTIVKRLPNEKSIMNSNNYKTSPLSTRNDYCNTENRSVITSKDTIGKENYSPVTPTNVSSLFEDIKFTPLSAVKTRNNLDYLASLPTPVYRVKVEAGITNPDIKSKVQPKRLSTIMSPEDNRKVEYSKITLSAGQKTSESITLMQQKLVSSPNNHIAVAPTVFSKEHYFSNDNDFIDGFCQLPAKTQINKTFDLKTEKHDISYEISSTEASPAKRKESDSAQTELVPLNRTTTIDNSKILSIIEEEVLEVKTKNLQQTFNITGNKIMGEEDIKRDVQLVCTPLRTYSESLKDLSQLSPQFRLGTCNQGSLPNLNDLDTIDPIESNRYYQQHDIKDLFKQTNLDESVDITTSMVSNHEKIFNHNEILAQSSRFNINEVGIKSNVLTSVTSSNTKCYYRKYTSTPGIKYECGESISERHKRTREISAGSPNSSNNYLAIDRSNQSAVCMAVSPPKRTKFNEDLKCFMSNPQSTKSNVNTWSRRKPKKVRATNTLCLKVPITPRKVTEERKVLYDSHLFLQTVINPDPFAATTTCDPFLTATMYLDERSLLKHEMEFKKWLNALVTIPAEFDFNKKIDVGRLFHEIRNKDVSLAPSKEERSMSYLTKSRMDSLRFAAVQLFMSEEMREPCSRVAVCINKKLIEMRKDRDLHLDVVLQRYILELLLCFNPLWLRIGLEAVFGEIVGMSSNSDIVGLSTFILNRLFRDKYIEQNYTRAYTFSKEYSEHIKKFTLQKFLFLLLFLDKAKAKRIIRHNPCLFVKTSPYKETREILIRFSSELLASMGDITRNLKRFGYVLTHKQTFLDEFNYAFNNIAVDMRDGIRLTRVMEIILLKDGLTQQLRVPAISRLQRIFNVNLALKALSDASFELKGDITAADIVDGHREKTLSLLWQIIYKFRAPIFNEAANVIQQWWRKSWLKTIIRRRIQHKIQMRRHNAAVVIQSTFRGCMARRFVDIFKAERVDAAICLQKYVRRFVAQIRFQRIVFSTITIQRWYRSSYSTRIIRYTYMQLRQSTVKIQIWYRRILFSRKLTACIPIIRDAKVQARLQYEKAIVIQRCFKSYITRKKFRLMVQGVVNYQRNFKLRSKSAIKIQSLFRMISIRSKYLSLKRSAIVVQRKWRAIISIRLHRNEFIKVCQATKTIQVYFRGYTKMRVERTQYILLRNNAIKIQTYYRSYKIMKHMRSEFLEIRMKIILIQQVWRATLDMRSSQKKYLEKRAAIIKIQRYFRGQQLMRAQYKDYNALKHAASALQMHYRAHREMKAIRAQFMLIKSRTITLQRKWRATLLARRVRCDFLWMQYYTIAIQRRFRANCMMKKELEHFTLVKHYGVVVQQRFRANLLMKITRSTYIRKRQSAIRIQQYFRGYIAMKLQRAKYVEIRQAVLCIQQHYRGYNVARKVYAGYIKLRWASIVIQRHFRTYLAARKARRSYLLLRSAAIVLQQRYRVHLSMKILYKKYMCMRSSAICIQIRFRSHLLRKQTQLSYIKLKNAVIIMQCRYRAIKSMRKARDNYRKIKTACEIIQRQFRSSKLMKIQRAEYLRQRNATCILQSYYRAHLLRNIEYDNYHRYRNAVVVVQTRFRANCEMRKARDNYTILRSVTLFLQRSYRAKKKMEMARSLFQKKRNALIVIQRYYRATVCMRKEHIYYEKLKWAVKVCQIRYRAKRQMEVSRTTFTRTYDAILHIQRWYKSTKSMQTAQYEYRKTREAIIIIQRQFRSFLVARSVREEFVSIRKSIVIIQRRYRAWQLMRAKTEEFLEFKRKVIIIQRYFRTYLMKKTQRKQFLELKQAAGIIQRRFKALLMMRKQRDEYLRILQNTRTIQIRFRALVEMRIQRQTFLHLKTATVCIQRQFRSILIARKARASFLLLKKNVLVLQRRFRARCEMLKIHNQYLLIRSLVINLQRSYRNKKQMLETRQQFLKLRCTTVLIQRRFRSILQARQDRRNFKEVQRSVIGIQARIRGVLARKRFLENMTPERREQIKREKAAKSIQAAWRGYLVRKVAAGWKIKMIRRNIKELAHKAKPCNTLRYKICASIKFLKGRFNIQDALCNLLRLENISRTVPHSLMEYAHFIASFCYGIMAQAIRSEADKQLIELCSKIILNLARFDLTRADTFQENGLVTIAQMLLRWCDKDCEIFNTLCTLIWVFAQCDYKKQKIREFMTSADAIFMLRETKKLVARKEKMRQNIRKPLHHIQSISSSLLRRKLPSLEPDFNVIKTKPYTFLCSIFAFDTVLSTLEIYII